MKTACVYVVVFTVALLLADILDRTHALARVRESWTLHVLCSPPRTLGEMALRWWLPPCPWRIEFDR